MLIFIMPFCLSHFLPLSSSSLYHFPPLPLPPSISFSLPLSLQVRYTQLVHQKKRKPGGRDGRGVGMSGVGLGVGALGRLGRSGSRRSGYAFAHQEGFGELITSGKNMRLSSLALATFASRHSSSWIDTLRKKKHGNSASNNASTNSTSASANAANATSVSANANGQPHTPPAPALSHSSSLSGSQDTPPEEAGLSSPPEAVAGDGIHSSTTMGHANGCALGTSPEAETGDCGLGAVQVRDKCIQRYTYKYKHNHTNT